MIFIFIGLVVGLSMGITGAGGAIIAIPMFQILLNVTLREATILSLLTVILGTGVNLIGRFREVNWKISLGFLVSGTISSYFSMPLKAGIPENFIVGLLVMIGSFSIWSVWQKSRPDFDENHKTSIFMIFSIGLLLGLITTLTGLGGGVLLIPVLLRIFHMSYEKALPTSLFSILLISSSALLFQSDKALGLIKIEDILLVAAGALSAFGALRFLLRSLGESEKLKMRKIVFSLATVVSLAIVIFKNL